MRPIISVIIATFNAEKTLEICLDSIAVQKDEWIELIVMDGGSTDRTNEILANNGNLIDIVISEKDRGIYDAWNKGVALAHGEWIMFIGADDTLVPDAFSKYITFLNSQDITSVDYICAMNNYYKKDGTFIKEIGVPWCWEQLRHNMKLAHVASLHRFTLFQEVGMYDLQFPICGDYELLMRKRSKLNSLFLNACIARMTTGGVSYSIKAISEAHKARKLHSGLSAVTLNVAYIWQILLYLRHRLLHL
jgi:glycosyltransferase involved in cell wall biosynthesis